MSTCSTLIYFVLKFRAYKFTEKLIGLYIDNNYNYISLYNN